nr:mediator of RNA polymerase II transcription subunit 15A isoform X8 [Ipomoea batatas]
MDGNNWRTAQAQGQAPAGDATAPAMVAANGAVETVDWRAQLQPESRQRIVNKIMETLKRHLPFHGPEGLHELRKVAVRFEEKIYAVAVSQSDYLRKISLKMLAMETKSPNPMANSLQSNNTTSAQNPQLPGTHNVMQNQVNSQGYPLSIPMVTNQSQTRQQLVSQNIQNNITSTGLQSSANMVPALPTGRNLAQPSVANVVNQSSGLQNIQASLDSTAQTGYANGADWQEEAYQKIKSMKDMHFMDLIDLHAKISTKLAQCESLQQPPTDQINKLRNFKSMVERFLHILQLNKSEVQLQHKEGMVSIEKQILYFLNSNRPRKPVQQGQPQHTQTHDNQINPRMQSVNLQGSMATMQHSSLSSVSAVSGSQHNMINTLQHGTGVDLGQGSLQQNPVSGPQQINMSSLSSQSGANTLSTLQPSSNILQHEQQMLHNQQMRHQMQQQQQIKQSQTPLTAAHQMQQLHQISDSNDLKMRQQIAIKSGVLPQQHQFIGQRVASSPQLQQPLSPQLSQHSSPQIDHQNIQSLPNAGSIGHQQAPGQSLAIGTPGISALSPLLAEFSSLDGAHANVEQPLERQVGCLLRHSVHRLVTSTPLSS